MAFSPAQYDVLERAVARGSRVIVTRRGTPWIVVARQLVVRAGRECLEARHPSTGEFMSFHIDEIDFLEVLS